MRPKAADVLMSVSALTVLFAALIALDERVRDQVSIWASGVTVDGTSAGLSDIGSAVMTALREQSIEHAPLTIFVVVALVLVVFMLRT